MILQITATTDGRYVGLEFPDGARIQLADDVVFIPDRIMAVPGGWRFITSNYVIDAKEVQ